MPVDPIGEPAEESQIESGGKGREHFATYKQRFSVDENAIKGMSTQFDNLSKSLKSVNDQLDAIISKGKTGMDALGGIAGASGGGAGGAPLVSSQHKTNAGLTGSTGASLSSSMFSKLKQVIGAGKEAAPDIEKVGGDDDGGGRSIMGGMKSFGKWMTTGTRPRDPFLSTPAMQVAMAGMNWTRNRYQGASNYNLTSDRTGMLLRQMYGGSQLDYQSRQRQPLTDYLLGNEGIERMLALQLTTGLGRTPEQQARMARGVEGIRVASGFGYDTGQATQMINALAQPGSSNMMTMMLGMGLYGPGGQQRDPMNVVRNVVRRMGLTNEEMVQGAFQPGSMTRANLARTGLPMDMQDMVLQYAQENIEFQKKGGEGMYDPASQEDRRLMGVDKGYATEFERTRREETRREERFYRRQVDNFEAIEKNTQTMIKLTAALEDRFSTLIGAQMKIAQHPATRLGLPLVGALVGSAFGMTAIGAMAGMAISNAIGDEDDPASSKVTPTNFSGKGLKSSLVGEGTGIGIQPMANAAAAAGHKLTLTSGTRTNAEQRALFEARHNLVIPGSSQGAINGRRRSDGLRYADGTGGVAPGWYELNSVGMEKGLAMPPGASNHQTGDAADLGPESAENWIAANAGRFGLKNPTNAQGAIEKWHVSLSGSGAPQSISAGDMSGITALRTAQWGGTSSAYASSGIAPIALPQGASKTTFGALAAEVSKVAPIASSLATTSGTTITIAPSITLVGTGSDAVDAQNLANKVIKIIETSDAVQALRTS